VQPVSLEPTPVDEADERSAPTLSAFEGLGKHTLVYALGMIVGRAMSFLMLPIYTRYLTPADYGVMALIELTLDFIAIVAGAQLALGVFRFYHKATTTREREEFVSTAFLLVAGMYCLVGLVTLLAAAPLSQLLFGSLENVLIIRVAAVNIALGALMIVPLSLARVRDRSILYVGAGLVKLFLSVVGALVFLVWLGLGVLGVFLATLIANAVVGGALTVWLYRTVGPRWSREAAAQLLRYGIPLVATQFATWVATFSDRYFLQAAGDEAVVGLYSLAYQFGFIMVIIGFSPLDQVWGPRRFRAAAEPDSDRALARGFLLVNVLLLSVAVAISLFVYDFLRILTTPAFFTASKVVPLILIAYVFQCWASVQDIGILVREKTEYITIANVGAAAVAVLGYLLLIPHFLAWGAAVATVLAFFTRWALTYVFSQRLHPVRYAWRPVLLLAAWAVVVSGVALLLPPLSLAASIGVRASLGALFLAGVWLLPILGDEDRRAARSAARTAWSFGRQRSSTTSRRIRATHQTAE
jgi:O-antigen/teichoic acid export membrane protein